MVRRGQVPWASLAAAEREEMEEVVAMLTEAAAQGHMMAQAYLAEMYDFGFGVAQDDGRAFELRRQAAQQGLRADKACSMGNKKKKGRKEKKERGAIASLNH